MTDDQKPAAVFVADLLHYSFKGDLASLEHPLFALNSRDTEVRKYERNGLAITIKPGADGCATIHDKDVWYYCAGQILDAMSRGREVGQTVKFVAYDFLTVTDRGVDGDAYRRLGDSLARLSGTRIETNIETAGRKERAGFGLLDSWRIETDDCGKMLAITVEGVRIFV